MNSKYWVNFNPKEIVFVKKFVNKDGFSYTVATIRLNEIESFSLFTNNLSWSKDFGKFNFVLDSERKFRIFNHKTKTSDELKGERMIEILKDNSRFTSLYLGKKIEEETIVVEDAEEDLYE